MALLNASAVFCMADDACSCLMFKLELVVLLVQWSPVFIPSLCMDEWAAVIVV